MLGVEVAELEAAEVDKVGGVVDLQEPKGLIVQDASDVDAPVRKADGATAADQ